MGNIHQSLASCTLIKWLRERNSEFLPGIVEAAVRAEHELAHQVPRIFPHYTKHDIEHSARVIENMAALIGDVDLLTELDVALLVYSAILHDIGMAIGDNGISQIKSDTQSACAIKYSAMLKIRGNDESLALQDIVRKVHADISAQIVCSEYAQYMKLPQLESVTLADDVAAICRCHTKDVTWIEANVEGARMKGAYAYNPRYACHILRIADLLDFDARRTPLCLYKLINPGGISKDEWQQHFAITNTEKVRRDKLSGQKVVVIYGNCADVHLHRKILTYIGWINAELAAATRATEAMQPQYRLLLRDRVDHHIATNGYSIADFKLAIDFRSVSTLLMGEHLYGKRSYGLRELVQNSIDACLVHAEVISEKAKYGDLPFLPRIQIILDENSNTVTVRDNGCGMTEETIRKYFLNIGCSYYSSEDFALQGFRYRPIGAYGIGFLSCFMLSDSVLVKTRHFSSDIRCDIALEKGSEFISFTRTRDCLFVGTEVVLNFSQFIAVFDGKRESIINYLKFTLLTQQISVEVVDRKDSSTHVVATSLSFDKALERGHADIDLSAHMNGVAGKARLVRKKTCIERMSDLGLQSSCIVQWTGDELIVADDYSVASLVADKKLQYVRLDVYSESDRSDFDLVMERFDDVEDVIDKFDKEASLYIVMDPSLFYSVNAGDTDCNEDYYVMSGVSIADVLERLGYSGFVPRVVEESVNLMRHSDRDVFLPFGEKYGHLGDYSGSNPAIYVRGVRVGNAALPNLMLPTVFAVKDIVLNIIHPSIVPDISRNSFEVSVSARVSAALHRAIIAGWMTNYSANNDEKELLALFLEKYYATPDALIRN